MTNVAFVGAGNMAREHARALADIDGVKLAGVYSRTPERGRKLGADFGMPAFDSIAALHAATQADLVVIAVSELSAGEVTAECFAYPWTCLIEKPAGHDLPAAEAIAAAARAQHRQAYVALNRRHYSSTRAVVNALANDEGARFIHVQDQEDPRAALAVGRPKAVCDNWMYANSIHLIDLFAVLGRGHITGVQVVQPWRPDDPSVVIARISYDSGDIGLYQAVWNRPGPWAVAVTTASVRWEMRPIEDAAFQPYGQRKLEPVARSDWDTKFKPGLRAQAELAVRAARNEAAPELPTLDDALASMRLTRDIYSHS